MAGKFVVGLLVILLFVAGFLGPFIWAATPHISGREAAMTPPAQAALNGKLVLMCAGDRQDLLYLYQNLKGEPVGIAVVPSGCRTPLP